jgi:hypothetical protein
MQTINAGYQSLSFLINLNWDRLMYGGAIAGALWIGSIMGNMVG